MTDINWYQLKKQYRPIIDLLDGGGVCTVELETDNEIYFYSDDRYCYLLKNEEEKYFKYIFKGYQYGKKLSRYMEK